MKHHLSFQYEFPAKNEPTWRGQVDRWYQLDAYAYGLAEFFSEKKNELQPALDLKANLKVDLIILASPGASNETDYEFASSLTSTGVASPSKFVHTLPNIRISPLLQVMQASVPMLCFQNDRDTATTMATAISEAEYLLAEFSCIWVLSAYKKEKFTIECMVLTQAEKAT